MLFNKHGVIIIIIKIFLQKEDIETGKVRHYSIFTTKGKMYQRQHEELNFKILSIVTIFVGLGSD